MAHLQLELSWSFLMCPTKTSVVIVVMLFFSGKTKSFISVEMLETMLDDPKIQQMVFPYVFAGPNLKEMD